MVQSQGLFHNWPNKFFDFFKSRTSKFQTKYISKPKPQHKKAKQDLHSQVIADHFAVVRVESPGGERESMVDMDMDTPKYDLPFTKYPLEETFLFSFSHIHHTRNSL